MGLLKNATGYAVQALCIGYMDGVACHGFKIHAKPANDRRPAGDNRRALGSLGAKGSSLRLGTGKSIPRSLFCTAWTNLSVPSFQNWPICRHAKCKIAKRNIMSGCRSSPENENILPAKRTQEVIENKAERLPRAEFSEDPGTD